MLGSNPSNPAGLPQDPPEEKNAPEPGLPTWASSLFASLLGMVTCRRAFVLVAPHLGAPNRFLDFVLLATPFVVGGVATGVLFKLLSRRPKRSVVPSTGARPRMHVPISDRGVASTGALAVALTIVGVGAGAGAFLGGALAALGMSPANVLTEGVIPGGVIGAGFGALLAVPAGVVVSVIRRKSTYD